MQHFKPLIPACSIHQQIHGRTEASMQSTMQKQCFCIVCVVCFKKSCVTVMMSTWQLHVSCLLQNQLFLLFLHLNLFPKTQCQSIFDQFTIIHVKTSAPTWKIACVQKVSRISEAQWFESTCRIASASCDTMIQTNKTWKHTSLKQSWIFQDEGHCGTNVESVVGRLVANARLICISSDTLLKLGSTVWIKTCGGSENEGRHVLLSGLQWQQELNKQKTSSTKCIVAFVATLGSVWP